MIDASQTKILIVDDENAIRQSFSDHLEDLGYQTLTAENGRIGLDLFDREQPHLVLVDLRMPEMDGLEVLSRISKDSPETPLIVASGTGVVRDAIEALHQGAWDYLLKPIDDLSVLSHAVSNALEKAWLQQENRRYQDNLERLVAEQTKELKHANEELKTSEQQFRAILDTIRTGIVIVEKDTKKISYVNPTAAELIGADVVDLINNQCFDVMCPTEEGHCPVLESGQGADSVERLIKTSDDQYIPVLKTVTCTNHQGKRCLLESFIDLTAQKQAAEEKEALETQLRQAQKMEALGTLAGGIAHDFNNILSAIIGFTELGFMELQDPTHPLYEKLNSILHAGNRAKDLVSQILAFSRMQEQMLTPVRVASIVKEGIKLLKASLPADIQIKSNISARDQVLADPTQIHQIVMNLCTNAYHAMQEHGGTLSVSLQSQSYDNTKPPPQSDLAQGKYLHLTISDTGTGISPANMDRIFDPYFSTKEKDKGTGLGLAVVHGIVKSHGGAISVSSQVGKGTTFDVVLPVTEATIDPETAHRTNLPRGKERVLFVDDEDFLVEIGNSVLEKLGYDVTGVVGSLEALKLFEDSPQKFDLVITDLNMPGLTGDRLSQKMIRIRPDLPIIMCTGFSERFDQNRARAIGIRKFIMKPLAMNVLAKTIREVLDEAK